VVYWCAVYCVACLMPYLFLSYLFYLNIVFTCTQVITSCNSTKDELIEELNSYQESLIDGNSNSEVLGCPASLASNNAPQPLFHYLDHVRTYPTFTFAGVEGSPVATVAFLRSHIQS